MALNGASTHTSFQFRDIQTSTTKCLFLDTQTRLFSIPKRIERPSFFYFSVVVVGGKNGATCGEGAGDCQVMGDDVLKCGYRKKKKERRGPSSRP
jgi:hypothetical protein